MIGTPLFMAPEQLSRGRLGPATDLYALAVVLHLLLTGTTPDAPDGFALLETTPPSDAARSRVRLRSGMPEPVARVIARALERDPVARQASAHGFALDLAQASAAAFGPGWLARSGMPVQLADDVRAAADDSAGRAAPRWDQERGRTRCRG